MGKKEANEGLKKLLYGKRSCGTCRACCTTHYINELKKEEGVPCPNLHEDPRRGCAVYDSRPVSCAAWACLWRSGSNVLTEEERPDKVGVVIEVQGEDMLVAKEAFEGGFTHAMKLLTRLANKRLVQLREADGKSGVAFGPSHQMPKYIALMDVVRKAEKRMRDAQQVKHSTVKVWTCACGTRNPEERTLCFSCRGAKPEGSNLDEVMVTGERP